MKHVAIIALGFLVALAGCTKEEDRVSFNGIYFKTKASKEADDLSVFVASVTPVSASFEGALEAGRYEGIKYCIKNYGTSSIVWSAGPDDEPGTMQVTDDTLYFRGKCKP